MYLRATVFAALFLGACAQPPAPGVLRDSARSTPHILTERPQIQGYGRAIASQSIPWSRQSVADDFRRVMFHTEWGARVPGLKRWDRAARVAVADEELRPYRPFLDALVSTIKSRAPAAPVQITDDPVGDITLRIAPREEMEELAADALCFFVPFRGDWRAFRRASERGAISWAGSDSFEAVTIFIPAFAAPYEIRACILEEVTQALGPTNDISGFEDSIFNDDNAHIWPTRFDLLILQTLYDQRLSTGQNEIAARSAALRALGASDIDFGTRRRRVNLSRSDYDDAVADALGPDTLESRRAAAATAIAVASDMRPRDHRLGEALKTAAFVAYDSNDLEGVITNLIAAEASHMRLLPPDSPHLARVRAELAINLASLEQYEPALALLALANPVFAANGADWQLTHGFRWTAISLSQLGEIDAARAAALETLAWARYVYGADSRTVRAWRDDFEELGIGPGA